MSIDLSPELEQYVQEQVKSGRFASPVEVLEAGVARLKDDQRLDMDISDQEMKEIEESEREIAEGKALDWKVVSAELRREFLGE